MMKIDLHVHSKYSDYQKSGIIQKMGVAESYSEPEDLYRVLIDQGMDFVTITDHNRIEGVLQLKKKYPEKVILGVETTAIFPEDGCQVHILIYAFSEDQFQEIQNNRFNIYHLRDYLKSTQLAYSVAHPTYSVDGLLRIEHLEKLLLLFDIFEGLDSWLSSIHNDTWNHLLSNLTPGRIQELQQRYHIEPYSETPWLKGRTGGSNDHSGLNLAKAYTIADGESITDFIQSMKDKKTSFSGLPGDFRSHVLSTYNISWDFSKKKGGVLSQVIFQSLNEHLYNSQTVDLWKKYKLHRYVTKLKKQEIEFQISLVEMGNNINQNDSNHRMRTTIPFEKISEMVDSFFSLLFNSIDKDIKRGKLLNLIRNLSLSLPGLIVIMPFFYSVYQLFKDHKLVTEIQEKYTLTNKSKKKKVLWFSDTIFDLNGVAVIMKNILKYSSENDYQIFIVGCSEIPNHEYDKMINLPSIHHFQLPYYKLYMLQVPSFIRSLEIIMKAQPDEIIISTPGPVGLTGLLVAKLMNIKCTGIYHTDFAAQMGRMYNESLVIQLIEELSLKFYGQMDEILVPSKVYIDILAAQGFDSQKMKILPSGIDTNVFIPRPNAHKYLMNKYNLDEGIYLLFTGRTSKDKNIDILLSAFTNLAEEHQDITLIIVGDGPYRKTAKKKYLHERIIFTGLLPYTDLPLYYAGCDLFVFPSTTDTYGLSVMEAQSCGLPALVSNVGGPQEIIIDQVTGFILPDLELETWQSKMEKLIIQIRKQTPEYLKMKEISRQHIIDTCSWNAFFETILEGEGNRE